MLPSGSHCSTYGRTFQPVVCLSVSLSQTANPLKSELASRIALSTYQLPNKSLNLSKLVLAQCLDGYWYEFAE